MQLAEKLDIEGLLTAVAGSDSWNSADYSRLDQFADRDFEKFFRETKQERLFKLLRTLDERLTDNKNPDAVSLRSKVRRVLKKIAADNKLNSFRVNHVVFRSKAEEDQKEASVITQERIDKER